MHGSASENAQRLTSRAWAICRPLFSPKARTLWSCLAVVLPLLVFIGVQMVHVRGDPGRPYTGDGGLTELL